MIVRNVLGTIMNCWYSSYDCQPPTITNDEVDGPRNSSSSSSASFLVSLYPRNVHAKSLWAKVNQMPPSILNLPPAAGWWGSSNPCWGEIEMFLLSKKQTELSRNQFHLVGWWAGVRPFMMMIKPRGKVTLPGRVLTQWTKDEDTMIVVSCLGLCE